MLIPYYEVKASSTIFNPYFCFPEDRLVQEFPNDKPFKGTKIVKLCKLSFPQYDFALLFNDNSIIYFIPDSHLKNQHGNPLLIPLLYFISFKTFMHYNQDKRPEQNAYDLFNKATEIDSIPFNLGRIVEKKSEHGYCQDIEPVILTLKKQNVEDFLSAFNDYIYLAICYYLIGCENIRYFLVEYYKSIEIIRNYFKNMQDMKEKLCPYGFLKNNYNKLKQHANNERKPLDIGRHAPKKVSKLHVVDMKHILENPISKEIFEESTRICREMIEIFIRYLKAQSN